MTTRDASSPGVPSGSFLEEAGQFWHTLPDKPLFFGLWAAWLALFHFFGNSTFGLVDTASLFGWWKWTIDRRPGEDHAYFMPLVTLGLLLWKSRELAALPKRTCWPALGLVALALLLHVVGYMIQQTRVSVIAFALGLYGLTGLVWGGRWLWATLFPFSLLLFCVPLSDDIDSKTLPLRLLATKITTVLSNKVLGISVFAEGTTLKAADGSFQSFGFDVGAPCSGIRSLTAMVAFGIVYGYVTFQSLGRRVLVVVAGVPLAIVANVTRLTLIILAAELFGQEGGNYVHNNKIFEMVPYLPAIVGMLLLGYWFDEDRPRRRRQAPPAGETADPLSAANPPFDP